MFLEKFGYYKIQKEPNIIQDLKMEQFDYYKIPFTIDDLSIKKRFEINSCIDARKKAKIIVIDDQEFAPLSSLRDCYHYDIKQLYEADDAYMVAEYDIVLCDNHGVAKKLNPKHGGASLIKEIKTIYPNKSVVAYTGTTFNPGMSDLLDYADKRMGKIAPIDDWVNVLDSMIEKKFDLKVQWQITRDALLKLGVSVVDVAKFESNFVEAVNSKSMENLKQSIKDKQPIGSDIIIEFLNISAAAISFLQSIGVL